MKMKQISHEVPLSLLEDSLEFNDYQYCLVHLLEISPKYHAHFRECVQKGVKVLLDNSLFELGKAFDEERFADWVSHLRPDEYIIPDSMDDYLGTRRMAISWMDKYNHLPGKKIAVVHGRDYHEVVACYKTLDALGIDKLAFSFGCRRYSINRPYMDRNQARMLGRIELMNRLLKNGVINTDKPHHLLGAGLPQEFTFYKDKKFDWIESLDTSSPVVHGLKEIPYGEGGLVYKDPTKLADLIDSKITKLQSQIIKANIIKFRNIVN